MRLSFLLSMALFLVPTQVPALELRGACKVQLAGSSTRHDFAGAGACEPFSLQTTEAAGCEPVPPDCVLVVPVAGMRTGIERRDRSIRDIEAPVATRVSRLTDDARELSFDLEFAVSLSAYRRGPPSVLGLIRVADEVRGKVGLHLAPLPTPWQP